MKEAKIETVYLLKKYFIGNTEYYDILSYMWTDFTRKLFDSCNKKYGIDYFNSKYEAMQEYERRYKVEKILMV